MAATTAAPDERRTAGRAGAALDRAATARAPRGCRRTLSAPRDLASKITPLRASGSDSTRSPPRRPVDLDDARDAGGGTESACRSRSRRDSVVVERDFEAASLRRVLANADGGAHDDERADRRGDDQKSPSAPTRGGQKLEAERDRGASARRPRRRPTRQRARRVASASPRR